MHSEKSSSQLTDHSVGDVSTTQHGMKAARMRCLSQRAFIRASFFLKPLIQESEMNIFITAGFVVQVMNIIISRFLSKGF